MSLAELINIPEDMVRKRRLLPGMANSHASVGRVMAVEAAAPDQAEEGQADVAAYGGRYVANKDNKQKPYVAKPKESGKEQPSKPKVSAGDAPVTASQLQEVMAKLQELMTKSRDASSGRPKLNLAEVRCWNCKRKGHFERNSTNSAFEEEPKKKSGN